MRLRGGLDELGLMGIYARIFGQGPVEADFWPISGGFAKVVVDFEQFWGCW